MGWRRKVKTLRRWALGPAVAARPAGPLFESLEPRLLLAGDLPSISLIEADNRGLVVLTANADLNASTINSASVEVSTAGTDQIFGTGDDTLVSRTVEYNAASRQVRVSASVAADVRYRVRLNASIITGADGRFLDGEFNGAAAVSGDSAQGGDLIFFTRRPAEFVVRFASVSGNIDVTLFRDRTPLTVQNFLNYANRGVWDLTFIHRSVPGFVVQGGGFSAQGTNNYPRITQDPSVLNEPGISNLRGTIAMAKLGGNPNSATNEWFFNLGNNSSNLDGQNGGFTAFGEVRGSAGLAIMDALAAFQILNGQTVNGAFDEIPVVDRDAVLARPGALTLLTTDLIRFTRIALLVDLSDQPAQQLSPEGSVIFGAPDGSSGPRVQVFDLDGVGLGDLSAAIQVRFGRNGVISSVTIRDGLPSARIGIAISNAASVGSITDARRTPGGTIAFIVSAAPVSSIRFNSAITGFDLNGFVVPGLSLDDDIDDDGDTADAVAIFIQSGFLATLRLDGGVTGDVVVAGGFGAVTVRGTATNADFSSGALSTARLPTFAFGSVVDSDIRLGVGISSIRAREWRDSGGREESIVAASLGSLRIDGNFEAGLNLNQNIPNVRTLGSARIGGSIFGSAWAIQGPIGSLRVSGDGANWSLINATDAGAISLGRMNNAVFAFSGRVARLNVVDWQGGSFVAAFIPTITVQGDRRAGIAGDFIGTLAVNGGGTAPVIDSLTINGVLRDGQVTLTGSGGGLNFVGGIERSTIRVNSGDLRSIDSGPILNSTINVQRTLTTIRAERFEAASLQGGMFDTIVSRGDFQGELRPSAINRLDVRGDFAGSITTRVAFTVIIGGDLTASTITLSLTPNPDVRNFETFSVGGRVVGTDIRVAGRAGNFFAGAMIDSGLYIGAPAGLFGLPSSGAGFRTGATIQGVTIHGLPRGEASYVNSFIVALDLGTARLRNIATDNFGRVFGVAAGTIGLVETRIGNVTQRLTQGSPTPPPIGDFNIFVGFVPPPGVVL